MPKQSKEEILLINRTKAHLGRQDKLTLELQSKNCREYSDVKDIVYCNSCLDTDNMDECLFKGFRAFKRDKSGLRFGYYFPNAIQEISPLSRTSKRFNSSGPYNAADRKYLKSKLKAVLKDNILQDKPTDKRKKVILRKDFQQYRHLCDVCLTSIFNHHYVCPVCAIEICTACFSNWNKKPLAEYSKKDQCVANSTHSRSLFMTCQKYSNEEMNAVEMEVDNFDLDVYMQEASELQLVEADQVTAKAEKVAVAAASTTVEVVEAVKSVEAVEAVKTVEALLVEAGQATVEVAHTTVEVAEQAVQTAVSAPVKVPASVANVPDPWLMPLSPNSDDQNSDYIKTGATASSSYLQHSNIAGSDYIPSPQSQGSRGSPIIPYSGLQTGSNSSNKDSDRRTHNNAWSPQLKYTSDINLNNHLSSPPLSQHSSLTGTPTVVGSNLFSDILQSDGPCLTDTSLLPLTINVPASTCSLTVELQSTSETSSQLPSSSGNTSKKRSRSNYESNTTDGSSSSSSSIESGNSGNGVNSGNKNNNSGNNANRDFMVTEETEISLPVRITQKSTLDVKKFQRIWAYKDPLMVEGCLEKSEIPWTPDYFGEKYGNQEIEVIDCEDFSTHLSTAKEFFESYESEERLDEYCKKLGTSRVIKIKDWPPKLDFKEVFGDVYNDYMNNVLPVPEYCSEAGFFNLSNRLPEEYMPPDLGPKMFIAQASSPDIPSRTKLHCDMADAVNVMCFSAPPPAPPPSKRRKSTAAATTPPPPSPRVAAVWDVFASKDLEKVRKFIKSRNNKLKINEGFDPILSESTYLEEKDLKALYKKYGVKPFRFFQKTGDCVFVPAGCAHQVLNVAGSIKCAYDFLSPETLDMSHLVTSQFHDIKLEDKLQVKSTVLFTWKSLDQT